MINGIIASSIAFGILGNKLNFGGVVPDQTSNRLSSAGVMTSSFVGPAVNIQVSKFIIKKLKF
jgi:hypothetical protein